MTSNTSNNSPVPRYQRIVDDICERIAQGELKSGDAIPSQAALLERYKVSHMTLRKALDHLHQRKVISSQPGKGLFVQDPAKAVQPKDVVRVVLGPAEKAGVISHRSLVKCREVLSAGAFEMMIESDVSDKWDELTKAIMYAGTLNDKHAGQLGQSHLPTLLVGEFADRFTPEDIPQVGGDLEGSIQMACSWLRQLGHENVALFSPAGMRYWQAAGDYFMAQTQSQSMNGFVITDSDSAHLEAAIASAKKRPSALLVTGSMLASTVLHRLSDLSMRVPEDISVMAINTRPVDDLPHAQLSCVSVNQVDVWQEAAKVICKMIRTGHAIDRRISPRLIPGSTCKSPPKHTKRILKGKS